MYEGKQFTAGLLMVSVATMLTSYMDGDVRTCVLEPVRETSCEGAGHPLPTHCTLPSPLASSLYVRSRTATAYGGGDMVTVYMVAVYMVAVYMVTVYMVTVYMVTVYMVTVIL